MSELEFWKDLGNIFDAVLDYQRKNVEFNNRFINPWIRLGNIFEREDQTNDAVQAYKRAIEIDPDSAENWANLGDAQFQKGELDGAIASYRSAVALDPEAGWPLGNLALTLVSHGRADEAIPLYKKSIDLLTEAKDKAICWNRLGHAYRKLNDYENAFLAFQAADRLDGDNTGFNDTLDTVQTSESVIAPEEILEQMILEDEDPHPTPPEADPVSMEQEIQPGPDSDIVVALAPNMEMMEEETERQSLVSAAVALHPSISSTTADETDRSFDIVKVVEDVIAKVEQVYAEKETEMQAEEMPVAETVSAEEIAPVVEELIAEPELPPAGDDDANEDTLEESRRIPAWLTFKGIFKPRESETEAQVELVETISEIPQEAAVNESIVNMDVVETFTDPLVAQLTTEPVLSEESLPENAGQAEVENEALVEEQEMAAEEESAPSAESALAEETSPFIPEERAAEFAYEEFLRDASEPPIFQTDHVEAPLTKVSPNGEVRIVMDTKNAHVWNELGNIYLNANAYEDAIASYSKAIELDNRFAWPYSNLALAYVQMGRFAEAILLYQRGIELFVSDKDKAVTWNRLGNVYRRINDYGNAIAAYQTADELDPENATLSLRSSFGLMGNMSAEAKPALVA